VDETAVGFSGREQLIITSRMAVRQNQMKEEERVIRSRQFQEPMKKYLLSILGH